MVLIGLFAFVLAASKSLPSTIHIVFCIRPLPSQDNIMVLQQADIAPIDCSLIVPKGHSLALTRMNLRLFDWLLSLELVTVAKADESFWQTIAISFCWTADSRQPVGNYWLIADKRFCLSVDASRSCGFALQEGMPNRRSVVASFNNLHRRIRIPVPPPPFRTLHKS